MASNELFSSVKPCAVRFEQRYHDDSGAEIAVELRGQTIVVIGGCDQEIDISPEHARWFLRVFETLLPIAEAR